MWHTPCGITADNHEDMVSNFSLVSLHPIEIARQITLLTHDLVSKTSLDDLRTKKSRIVDYCKKHLNVHINIMKVL